MVVRRPKGWAGRDRIPNVIPGLTRVSSLNVPGLFLQKLLALNHTQLEYAAMQDNHNMPYIIVHILVVHGLTGLQLCDVVRATTMAQLLCAAPAMGASMVRVCGSKGARVFILHLKALWLCVNLADVIVPGYVSWFEFFSHFLVAKGYVHSAKNVPKNESAIKLEMDGWFYRVFVFL